MKPFVRTRMLSEAGESRQGAHKLITEMLIFLLLMFIATTLQGVIILPFELVAIFTSDAFQALMENAAVTDPSDIMASVQEIMNNFPEWFAIVQLLSTVAIVVTAWVYCRRIEGRSAASMGLHKRGAVGEYLAGLGIGLVLFSCVVGACCAGGQMSLSPVASPSVGLMLCYFVGFMIQGFSEELICRGYLMISLSRRHPVWVCVLTNALLFAGLHLFNPGISALALLNLTLFGAFASVYALRRGSLWGIAAIHSMWNLAQGNIFGLSVSGAYAPSSLLSATVSEGRMADLLNGGAFGPEGGIGVTLVLSLALIALLFVPTKHREMCQPETAQ